MKRSLWAVDAIDAVVPKTLARRDREAAETMLGGDFSGFNVSDRASCDCFLSPEQRQVCWAHLARDLQGVVDRRGPGACIGEVGLRLKRRVFSAWHDFRVERIGRRTLIRRMDRVAIELGRLLQEGSEKDDKTVARFCKKVLSLEKSLFPFASREGVEPATTGQRRC
jgi:hypothetical protein